MEKNYVCDKPWGNYEIFKKGGRYQIKIITVAPGERLSLQKHFHRSEHWVVVRGTALVTVDGKEFICAENGSVFIPIGSIHRLENKGKIELKLVEIQYGSYLEEDDIIRIEDNYKRK